MFNFNEDSSGNTYFENKYNNSRDFYDSKDITFRKKSLTKSKLETLEMTFRQNPFPSKQLKHNLATELNLDLSKIKNWFQNRRAREKKTFKSAASDHEDDKNTKYVEVYPSCNNLYVRRHSRNN